MPIDISEFREPTLTKMQERWPMSADKKDRFIKFDAYPRNYRGEGGTFPQAGYNPHHQSTAIEKINLESDDYTLKPR